MIGEHKTTIKKRKYSRGGCFECKRRKMKCDEGKPECHNCTRLRKSCVYISKQSIKFQDTPMHTTVPKSDLQTPQAKFDASQEGATLSQAQLQDSASHIPHHHLTTSQLPVPQAYTLPQQGQHIHGHHPGPYPQFNDLIYDHSKVQSPQNASDVDQVRYFHSPASEGAYHFGSRSNNLRNLANVASITTSVGNESTIKTPKLPNPPPEVRSATSATASVSTPEVPHWNTAGTASAPQQSSSSYSIADASAPPFSANRPPFRNSILDILTPIENEGASPGLLHENHNVNSDLNTLSKNIDVDSDDFRNMREVFDEASLWVHDLNDLVTSDLLDIHSSDNKYELDALKTGQTPSQVPTPRVSRYYPDTNSDYLSGSEAGKFSDTFDKHNFHLDEFSNHIVKHSSNRNKPDSIASVLSQESKIGTRDLVTRQEFAVSNSSLIEQTIRQNNLEGPHVEYLKILTNTDLSYHLYPFASSVELNEVVHVLLKYLINCPYLLMSLLVISATFQYNQTGKLVHDLSRQKYLSVCLTLLSKEFNSSGGAKNNHKLANDIERLLLTVIVLTTNFTATSTDTSGTLGSKKTENNVLNSWKTHLRGAKDLLVSYSAVKWQMKDKMISVSPGLALAKIWFFALESLAGLMLPMGGTLIKKRDEEEEKKGNQAKTESKSARSSELEENGGGRGGNNGSSMDKIFADTGYFSYDQNPEYHDTLVKVGFLFPSPGADSKSEFNIFLGFTIEVVYLNQEFIESLNLIRSNPKLKIEADKSLKLMSLVYKAKQAVIVPGVSLTTYAIPTTSRAHPDYTGPDKVTFPATAYAKSFENGEANPIYFSWFDVSQQIRTDAVYLRILVLPNFYGVPKSSHTVRELVKRILGYMFFVKEKDTAGTARPRQEIVAESEHYYLPSDVFDIRCVMIQALFRLCVPFAETDLEFEKLKLFFDGLVQLGNGSAMTALEMVKRQKDRNVRRLERGDDVISDEETFPDDYGREVIAFS